jgi:hypothetical protein
VGINRSPRPGTQVYGESIKFLEDSRSATLIGATALLSTLKRKVRLKSYAWHH